jgi:carboxylesterase
MNDDLAIRPGAEPIYYPGKGENARIGALCLHGFTASPQEMAWLAHLLAEKGLTVFAPRLFGHGVQVKHLIRARWEDWYLSALDGYHILRQTCEHIFTVGLSMGGLQALRVAAFNEISGVIALAAPLILSAGSIPHSALSVTHALRYVLPYTPPNTKGGADPLDTRIKSIQRVRGEAETGRVAYDRFTVGGISELLRLQTDVRANLHKIDEPVLLMYSEKDDLVPYSNAELIRSLLTGSRSVQIATFKESKHILTNDVEYEQVLEKAWAFIHEQIATEIRLKAQSNAKNAT